MDARSLAECLADFVGRQPADVRRKDVAEAVDVALLDWLACVEWGWRTPTARQAAQVVSRQDLWAGWIGPAKGLPGSSGSPSGTASSAPLAALLYGTAAHSLDFDDTLLDCMVHTGAVVCSTAVALAERVDVSRERLRIGIAHGYEVTSRVGCAVNSPPNMAQHRRGIHPTMAVGVFGATATAASMLGLPTSAIAHAFALAGSFAGGLLEFLSGGGEVKRLHPGKAAHDGIMAVLLAQHGLTGPLTVFEGRDGYLRGFGGADVPVGDLCDAWRQPLPNRPAVATAARKRYACCHHIHASLDGLAEALRQSGREAAAIAQIDVDVPTMAYRQVGEPIDAKRRPHDLLSAQMSAYYCMAVLATKGAVEPTSFSPISMNDTSLTRLADRIVVNQSAEMDTRLGQGQMPARVRVRWVDETTTEILVTEPAGTAARPLTVADLQAKLSAARGDDGTIAPQGPWELLDLAKRLMPDRSGN